MTEWILTSSVLILLVIAVRGLFKEKMKAKYTYALWLLVLVRLLCPVNFGELSFNLLSLAEEGKERMEEREAPAQETDVDAAWEEQKKIVRYPVDSNNLPESYLPVADTATAASPTVMENNSSMEGSGFQLPEINWQKVLPVVWAVGITVMIIVIFSVNISFSTMLGLFRKELPAFTRKGRGKQKLTVYLADGINSSCLYGVVRPSIYLNKQGMGEQEKKYCVEHEYSHYLQGDMVWSLCRTVCLILHWYNPLVWLAVVLSKKDAELACDERTIERLGEEERYSYGHTLVELAACQSRAVQMFGMATLMASDKKEVVNRVKAITTKKQTKIITGVLVMCLLVGIGCFVFTGVAKGEQENNKNAESVATETPTPMPTLIVDVGSDQGIYDPFLNYEVSENGEFPVQGQVLANRLNVRRDAGTDFDKIAILSKGTKVTIHSVTEADNTYWYLISYETDDAAEISAGSQNMGFVMSCYITWAGEFRLYESPEENSDYITLEYSPEILCGIADAGSEWFYTETPDYQSGWVKYGEHGGVDERIRELLRISATDWDKNREAKKQEIVLTLAEDVNYTPLSFVDHVALEQVPGEGWIIDLNGDGEQEKLYINADGVYINGEKKFMFSYKQTFWMLDIDTTDKMYELLTSNGTMYIYDGKEFQCVKGIQEYYFAEESSGTSKTFKRYFGTLNEFTRIDEHTISFEDYFCGWTSFFAEAQYTLDENHGLQVIPQEYEIQTEKPIDTIVYSDYNDNPDNMEAKKFKLYAEQSLDSNYVEVNWLSDVSLLKSDCVEWVYIETESGLTGWLYSGEESEYCFTRLSSN